MANVKTVFFSSENDNMETELQCFFNANNEIFISIDDGDRPPSFICLDKSTSIKLVKVLKTEISKIVE